MADEVKPKGELPVKDAAEPEKAPTAEKTAAKQGYDYEPAKTGYDYERPREGYGEGVTQNE